MYSIVGTDAGGRANTAGKLWFNQHEWGGLEIAMAVIVKRFL